MGPIGSSAIGELPIAGLQTPTSDVTVALTGAAATFAAGAMAPATALALLGAAATFAAGTMAPPGDITVALVGASATFAPGALAGALSVAAVGAAGTFAAGTTQPASSIGVAGQRSTFALGTMAPGLSEALAGAVATFAAGAMAKALAVAMLGQRAIFTTGVAGGATPSPNPASWTPFRMAQALHSLRQGTLNVGNARQNTANLLAMAMTEANAAGVWAKWRPGFQSRTSSAGLLIYVSKVPGYTP